MDRLTPQELWVLFSRHGKPAGDLSPLGFLASALKKPPRRERKLAEERLTEDGLVTWDGRRMVLTESLASQLRILYAPDAVIDATSRAPNPNAAEGRTLFFLAGDLGVEAYATEGGFDYADLLPRTKIFDGLAEAIAPGNRPEHHLITSNATYKIIAIVSDLLASPYAPKNPDAIMARLKELVDVEDGELIDMLARLQAGGVLEKNADGLAMTEAWRPVQDAVQVPGQVALGIRHKRRRQGQDVLLFMGPAGNRMMLRATPGLVDDQGVARLHLSWPGFAGLASLLDELTRKSRFAEIAEG
jgi:hypothetical protein